MSRLSRIAALAIVASAVVAAPAVAANPPKGVGPTLQASGFTALPVGMPVSDAISLLGKPASMKKNQKVAYGTVTIYSWPKYGVQVSSQPVSKNGVDDIVAVTVTSKIYSVSGNTLRVGATTAAVKKAYGSVASCTAKACTVKEGEANELLFDLKAGKVTAISAVSTV
jgi:hypothetical protein